MAILSDKKQPKTLSKTGNSKTLLPYDLIYLFYLVWRKISSFQSQSQISQSKLYFKLMI